MPTEKQRQPVYRPIPFNFIDLEEKATNYLAQVKEQAVELMTAARDEVVRIRDQAVKEKEKAFTEVELARKTARQEAENLRKQLDDLRQKLQTAEANFTNRKEQLEIEAVKLKAELKKNEDVARKNGYEDGKKLGYDEGHQKGYEDGELQAKVDYNDRVQREAEIQLGVQLETLLPAMQTAVADLETAKQAFLQRWEEEAVNVAVAIAEKAIVQQLPQMPDVPLNLLREALELCAGTTSLRLRLNPDDYNALKPQIDLLLKELVRAIPTEILPDESIFRGGCLVETTQGVIDNRIPTRLERIEQELILAD